MLHTNSHGLWPFGSIEEDIKRYFTINRRGGHLVHVTRTIVSLGLTYQVRIMTLASKVFKKITFQNNFHLNALGSKFDLDVK